MVMFLAVAASAQETSDSGRSWALLIGVQDYHQASRLRYTINDVREISHTLQDRGGYEPENVLEIIDNAQNPRFQPLRSSLLSAIPFWLKKPAENDRILVYFSGHGVRDKEGKLYLAPIDCDPKNPTETAVAAEWFRQQLAACKAKQKLLIIDACHAGSEKGDDDKSDAVPADLLAQFFRDTENVVTIASSTADQKSQLWEDKKQSLFSYWLRQGLKGHADRDGDSKVTIDELYQYTHRTVTHSARVLFPREQTPVRIVRPGTIGVPTVVDLQPQPLEQVLADMAEQLAWAMQERRLEKVGVLEFVSDSPVGELLGADFGILGRWSAQELERRLIDQGTGKFSVVNRRRLQSALSQQEFGINDLGSPTALATLSERAGGMPAIVVGALRSRAGRVVTLQCELLLTDSDESGGVVSGSALLSEDQWAMLGKSVAVRPEDRRPEFTPPGQTPRPVEDRVVDRLDSRAQGGHPHLDPAFPFRVKIVVDGKERQPIYRGNDMFVGLSKGENYEVWIENQSGQVGHMRLLVDGLNTLPEDEPLKGVAVSQIGRPISDLSEARAWVLDPQGEGVVAIKGVPTWAVRGFVKQTGAQGKLDKFLVVDAQDSLAARQEFTEQIGLITAAFYAPKGGSRGPLGTARGEERGEKIGDYKGEKQVGNLLGVVHIRYVEAAALKSAGR
ncbi:MAG: caspase family protein [Pirellulaceae bacterium]